MENSPNKILGISVQTIGRLPNYYNYLKILHAQGKQTVSSPAIARELRLNEVQVRKDLAAVSDTAGRPRTGFEVERLMRSIGRCLGYENIDDAVLVGVGQLGRALLSYSGFEQSGINILAAFDTSPALAGAKVNRKPVYAVEKIPSLCRRLGVRIGIIAVPDRAAQQVCNLLIEGGVRAVWNFAPVHLTLPENILIHNEDLAASLALLSRRLAKKTEVDL